MPHNEDMSKQVRISDEAYKALEIIAKDNCRTFGMQLEVLLRDEMKHFYEHPENMRLVSRDNTEPIGNRRAKAPAVKAKDYGRLQKGKK